MDFGVVLQTDPPARRVVGFARKAEALGFTHAYTFDSHVLWQEPYVIHSAMLAATSTLTVGPMVTNPGTRDWTVTASVFATLNEMYGERTVCGIGRGDSAMRVIGYPSCNLATLEEAMDVIKGLAEGGEVDYNGTRQTFPWCDGGSLPMWMAAYGPKALALCGRKADGFILQLADPQIAAWTIGAVRRAAEEAGRDPDSITICVVAPAYVGDDIAHQRDQVRWFGGMVGNHVADLVGRYGTDGTAVPQALTDYIEGRKGYDYSEHGRAGAEHTEFVPDEIIDRFCILGDEAAHIARLEELRGLGVDQFAIYLMHDQQDETLDAYGRHVMPALSGN
ncbi:MAG: TIGR03842 family LLM class F420-dependent oxidoreductase [Acidimicrobiaceae bacterium]|nr:TIGR03842 family LLM class F420-dependent oxidoreductase [Acidimicrobiaceae bacterium]